MVSHSNFEFLVFDYCFEFLEFPDNNKASNVTYLKTKSFVMKASLQTIYKLVYFSLFEVETILTNNNFDPDSNFFNEKINSIESTYYTHDEFVSFPSDLSENFSIIHLNIIIFHKNTDKLKDFQNNIKGKFSVIAVSETWIDNDKVDLNSLFHIPNFSFTYEKRKTNHKGGGLGIYAHKTLNYKILPNLAKNTENIETSTIEIENKNYKNILICVSATS